MGKAAGPGPAPSPPSPPTPPSPPSPPSPPGPPSATHYEDPKGGCRSDEVDITIQGIQGAVCSPASNDAQCGTNASCKSIQGTGLCTYDDAVDTNKATTVKYNAPANGHYEDPKGGCGSDEIDITV